VAGELRTIAGVALLAAVVRWAAVRQFEIRSPFLGGFGGLADCDVTVKSEHQADVYHYDNNAEK
jgi:hypothetical protein